MIRCFLVALTIVFSASTILVADVGPGFAASRLAQKGSKEPGLLKRLFAPRKAARQASASTSARSTKRTATGSRSRQDAGQRVVASGFRTLCVRTCDGYYFPVSNSVGRSRLDVDDSVCKAMYGGAPAELYYQPAGADVSRAVSLSGTRYADHPQAYRYRSTFDPACSRQLHAGLTNLSQVLEQRGETSEQEVATSAGATSTPQPRLRPSASTDPDTLANRTGQFRLTPNEDGESAPLVAMRQLGADYYYVAAPKIDALYGEPWRDVDLSFAKPAEVAAIDARQTQGDPIN